MRRIIHNSTAIAACLSMLLPQLATAQLPIPVAGEVRAGDATTGPLLLAQAEVKDQQLTEEQLRRELRRAERAAREQARETENDDSRPRGANAQKQAKPEAGRGDRTADQARKAAERAEKKAEKKPAARPEKAAAASDEARPSRRQDRSAEGARQSRQNEQQAERPAAAQRPADRQARPENRPEGQRPARAERVSEDELAQRLRERQERQDQKAEQQQRQSGQDQRREERLRAEAEARQTAPSRRAVSLASSDTARNRAGNMTGLSAILDREVAGGLGENRLACLSGGVYPCAGSDLYVTPRGVVLERNANGNYMLAPAPSQIYRVDGDGRLVSRDGNGRTQESQAARDAARETRAAVAAALREDRQRGRISEQRITEANRRSSSQDFQSSLRDALTRGDRQQRAEAEDNDDKSKLVKALLLGLGAVAVGSMLNNNRQVALSTPDRVVVTRPDGSQEVIKDEVALLRQPGSTVSTENFDDGSSRTIVTRPDGSRVVTIRDADLRILRRTLISADGRSTQLIDDTAEVAPVTVSQLPPPARVTDLGGSMDEAALRAALQRESAIDRRFTLGQIRNIPEVRSLVAPVDIDAITFDTGSAAITPTQARALSALGQVITDAVAANPREMFLIEGHTDTVGAEAMNLALSDRRAESVALALTEYFDVPPENLVVQGYGEQFLKIRAEGDVRENRRASVRRITDLLQTASAG